MVPVVRGGGCVLAHTPELVEYGSEVLAATAAEPDLLRQIRSGLRAFDAAVAYPPNQVFIGNLTPFELRARPSPWLEHPAAGAAPEGRFGRIVGTAEFYSLLALGDVFDLVWLDAAFAAEMTPVIARRYPFLRGRPLPGRASAEIEGRLSTGALPLRLGERLVGCARSAARDDAALDGHVILENLACKVSGALALHHALADAGLAPESVGFVLECSEVAVGDRFQRGGGNLAKAIGELLGCTAASGADLRAFCAAPVHSLIQAAALVAAGVHQVVAVVGGGSLAKLGMNCRGHLNKGLPLLEDCLAAIAFIVGSDDGINPVIRLDAIGTQPIGSGSSPQAVTEALVLRPLERLGLSLNAVDLFAAELQNPEITQPAGAGDVARANLRMIGALAVKSGAVARADFEPWVEAHGMPGFAATQGHCPAGVPFLPHARHAILTGELHRVQIIGKGSLFLGRMTNLSDGASILVESNPARAGIAVGRADPLRETRIPAPAAQPSTPASWPPPQAPARSGRVALVLGEVETDLEEFIRGAEAAARSGIDVLIVGPRVRTTLHNTVVPPGGIHPHMEALLAAGEIAAAVTTHYPFPLGVATVGRALTPGHGRPLNLATTTGSMHGNRVPAMILGAVAGLACAKASGLQDPALGILNVDGARQVQRALQQLQDAGYPLRFATSSRRDGGALMRGNDVLLGSCDLLVTDTLTGNLLIKMLAAFPSGGDREVSGWGYGPGIGPDARHLIYILSRASTAPVVAAALQEAHALLGAPLAQFVAAEWQAAAAAGLGTVLAGVTPGAIPGAGHTAGTGVPAPDPVADPPAVLDAEIEGIDVLALDQAVGALREAGIVAAPAMGCTGPVLRLSSQHTDWARRLLETAGFLTAERR